MEQQRKWRQKIELLRGDSGFTAVMSLAIVVTFAAVLLVGVAALWQATAQAQEPEDASAKAVATAQTTSDADDEEDAASSSAESSQPAESASSDAAEQDESESSESSEQSDDSSSESADQSESDASESSDSADSSDTNDDEGSDESSDSSSEADDSSASSEASAKDDSKSAASAKKGVLETTIKVFDGKRYTVRVSYDAKAEIPEDAELRVVYIAETPEGYDPSESKWRNHPTDEERFVSEGEMDSMEDLLRGALDVSDDDYVFYTGYLDIAIVADGDEITPESRVKVTVETNAVDQSASDSLEASFYERIPNGSEYADSIKLDNRSGDKYSANAKGDERAKTKAYKTGSKVVFDADELGCLGLAGVAVPLHSEQAHGFDVTVLGPSKADVWTTDASVGKDAVPRDADLAGAYGFGVNPERSYGTQLWVKAEASDEDAEDAEYTEDVEDAESDENDSEGAEEGSGDGHLVGYKLDGSGLGEVLFDTAKEKDPAAIDADDSIALVWMPAKADESEEADEDEAASDEADDTDADEAEADSDESDAESDEAEVDEATTIGAIVMPQAAAGSLMNVLNASSGFYTVEVTFGPDAGIPDGATIQARELTGTELELANASAKRVLGAGKVAYARSFDITILDADGNEVEPAAPVDVKITLSDAPKTGDPAVVHFGEGAPEVIDVATEGKAANTLNFQANSFSVYTVAYVLETQGNGGFDPNDGWTVYTISANSTEDGNSAPLYWKIVDGCLYIHCDADIKDSASVFGTPPWHTDKQNSHITSVVMTGDISQICSRMFFECKYIQSVDISGCPNIRVIKNGAFQDACQNGSTRITLDFSGLSHLKTIETNAFYNSNNIGAVLFKNCTNLKTINTNAFNYNYNYCPAIFDFSGCSSLDEVASSAFLRCNKVTDALFSDTKVDSIANLPLDPGNLTRLNLSHSKVTAVDLGTLGYKSTHDKLTEIWLPTTVTTLDLSRAKNLTIIHYDGSKAEWDALAAHSTIPHSVTKITYGVTPYTIKITAASDSKQYDGTPLTNDGCSFVVTESASGTQLAENELPEGHTLKSITVTGSQAVAGTSDNVPSDLVIVDADGVDVTDDYGNPTYVNGTLEVTKRPLTITAQDATKSFDGSPYTDGAYTSSGLVTGDFIESIQVACESVDPGEYANGIVASDAVIKNASLGDVTDSYDITYENGTLTINPMITVTSTLANEPFDDPVAFTFKVTLDDTSINATYGDLIFVDGVATFELAPTKDTSASKSIEIPYLKTVTIEPAGDTWNSYDNTVDEVSWTSSTFETIDSNKPLSITSTRKPICKIGEATYTTLAAAIQAAGTSATTIEMLVDYALPAADDATIPSGANITLTTAATGYTPSEGNTTGKAIVSRGDSLDAAMFTNNGTFQLTNIMLDGAAREVASPIVQNNASLTIADGATITNAASSVGAVYVQSTSARVYLAGDAKVTGNYESGSSSQQRNVVLDVSADDGFNQIVQVAEAGLSVDAEIGIYIPDTVIGSSTLYELHGISTMPFATYAGSNTAYLKNFKNDRNTYVGTNGDDNLVCWYGEICKIVDGDTDDDVHVYGSIKAAVAYAETKSEPVTIEMLVDYTIPGTDKVEISSGKNITLTTAELAKPEDPDFKGYTPTKDPSSTRATIERRTSNTNPFIKVNGIQDQETNTLFTMTDLVLDGRGITAEGAGGGALCAKYASVEMDNVTVKNFSASDGGAVMTISNSSGTPSSSYTTNNMSLTITNCTFEDCKSVSLEDEHGGGAVRTNAKYLKVENSDFTRCTAMRQAGALYHCYTKDKDYYQDDNKAPSFVKNCTFTDCKAGLGGDKYQGAGGAIESDNWKVAVIGSTFTCCSTNKNAGALNVYSLRNGSMNTTGTYVEVEECKFYGCVSSGGSFYGGALRSTAWSTTVADCEFKSYVDKETGAETPCSASMGGALACTGKGTNAVTTVSGCTFENCIATKSGGGVYVETKMRLTIEGESSLTNCKATNGSGGGVYLSSGSSLVLSDATIDGCTATAPGGGIGGVDSTLETSGTISNCRANQGGAICLTGSSSNVKIVGGSIYGNETTAFGGAIRVQNGSKLSISGGSIWGNTADGGGGAIHVKAGDVTISGGTISDNRAVKVHSTDVNAGLGGAIFFDSGTLTISGGTITRNSAQSANGGAINTGSNKVYLSGNPYIYDNPSADASQQKNLVLSVDNNAVINTTGTGLDSSAKIGVYTTENWVSGKQICQVHGVVSTPFATFRHNNVDSDKNIDKFINDRDDVLYGMKHKTKNDGLVYWDAEVCKITDAEDNLLNKPGSTEEAIYLYSESNGALYQAFSDFGSIDDAAYVKMIIPKYNIQKDTTIALSAPKELTFTIASTEDDDGHPYRGQEGLASVINRNKSTKSLIAVNDADATLAIQDITLDGDASQTINTSGGLVSVSSGTLSVERGATLRNSHVSGNGGAVYVASGGAFGLSEGGVIKDNRAACGGGVYVAEKSSLESAPGSVQITGGTISGNVATNNGGGIYIRNNRRVDVSNATLSGNSTSATTAANLAGNEHNGSGGAMYVYGSSYVNVSESVISGNDAYRAGGGIMVFNGGILELENVQVRENTAGCGGGIGVLLSSKITIDGDDTEISNNSAVKRSAPIAGSATVYHNGCGGGIGYQSLGGAGIITMTGGEVKENTAENNGGGIYLDGGNSNSVFDGVTITGNSAVCGGGAYTKSVTLKNNTQITGNVATSYNTTSNIPNIDAAGGLYLNDGTLTLDGDTESLIIDGNYATKPKYPSDLHLPKMYNSTNNKPNSVKLNSEFNGKIRVTNPGPVSTQFGTSDALSYYVDYPNTNEWSNAAIVSEDGSKLYGRVKTNASGSEVYLYWYQEPFCKITDANGTLLYKDEEGKSPAIYMRLYADGDAGVDTAIRVLNQATPALYYGDGSQYDGEDGYYVKMLANYEMQAAAKVGNEGQNGVRKITLTTAEVRSENTDGYYFRDSGSTATISPSSSLHNSTYDFMFRINERREFIVENITLDGGAVFNGTEDGHPKLDVDRSYISTKDGFLIQLTDKSTVVIGDKATLQNACTSHPYGGGAICIGNTTGSRSLTLLPGSRIYRCCSIEGNQVLDGVNGGFGGAITVYRTTSASSISIEGGTIEECWAQHKGGAIYMPNGKHSLTITGGSIKNCAAPYGGGIYLDNNGGSPAVVRLQGALDYENNYGTDYSGLVGQSNGADNDWYAGGKAPQDIFVNAFAGTNPVTSIIVTGAISADKGSIDVWCDPSNFKHAEQFAIFADGVSDALEASGQRDSTMQSFRDAQPNSVTTASDSYLTGVSGSEVGAEEVVDGKVCIYWGGSRPVILRKVSGADTSDSSTKTSLEGAEFSVYRSQSLDSPLASVDGQRLENLVAGPSGVFWVGELPYGEYYLYEESPNAGEWFKLTVNETGVTAESA